MKVRVVAVLAAALIAFTLATSDAGAHVTVKPATAPPGGFEILNFSVPNEKDDANTVKLVVEFPENKPIAFVSVKPMPGWTIDVEKATLAKPVKSHGDEITEAVSTITWTATDGGLEPGQFDLFTISAGPLPTNGTLTFKALQTYSDGETVNWIQTPVKGAPEPEHPAPTLSITGKATHD